MHGQGLQILLMSGVSESSDSHFWSHFGIFGVKYHKEKSHVYTIVRDTQNSCGGPLTWKAQIQDGGHRVNFDRNLPSSCFALILMI